MLKTSTQCQAVPGGRHKHELALPAAAANPNFAVPVQYEIAGEARKIREIPANALLAQLVEHFHGKEGVVGSSPTEGSGKAPRGRLLSPTTGATLSAKADVVSWGRRLIRHG